MLIDDTEEEIQQYRLIITDRQYKKIKEGVFKGCGANVSLFEDAFQEVILKLNELANTNPAKLEKLLVKDISDLPLLYKYSFHRVRDYIIRCRRGNQFIQFKTNNALYIDPFQEPILPTGNPQHPFEPIENLITPSFVNDLNIDLDIEKAIKMLNPLQRITINMRYWEDTILSQIRLRLIDEYGIKASKDTVKRLLICSREILRLYLGENYMRN